MNVIEKNNQIIIEGISDDFEPQHVFDCGQCFRWIRQEDGSYTGVVQGRVINVKKENDFGKRPLGGIVVCCRMLFFDRRCGCVRATGCTGVCVSWGGKPLFAVVGTFARW